MDKNLGVDEIEIAIVNFGHHGGWWMIIIIDVQTFGVKIASFGAEFII
jgi:hypothetical protein